jgi:ribonuclease-3 family protein
MEEYIKNIDVQTIPAQTLAFIGDAVYNVYIRTYLASISTAKAGALHKLSIKYVSAKGQSATIDKIMDMLTEEEVAVYKRGRNTNIATVSKHVDVIEYKKATGFECLIGYLYVIKNNERLDEIVQKCISCFE